MNIETLNTYTSSKNEFYKSGYGVECTFKNSRLGDYCLNFIKQSSLPFPLHPLTMRDIPKAMRERTNASGCAEKVIDAVKKNGFLGLCLIGKDTLPVGVVLVKFLVEKYANDFMSVCEAPLHYASAPELARIGGYRGEALAEELAPLKFHTILIVDGIPDPKCKIWAEVEQFRRRNGKITLICCLEPVPGFEALYLDGDEPQIDLAKLGRLLAAAATEHPTASKSESVRLLESLMEKASASATP